MNSEELLVNLRKLNVPEADIKDLFDIRYKIPYIEVLMGKIFDIPSVYEGDLDLIKKDFPLAYLIGQVNFSELTIKVNPSVLIPRVETEELVLKVIEEQKNREITRILDLCTGSGCIALSLKKAFPKAEVYASDISMYAVSKAQENAEINKLEINLVQTSYFEYFLNHHLTFDLIVSNPPYIPESEDLAPSLKYEPYSALYSGNDGLDSFKEIFFKLPLVLKDSGTAYFEIEASNAMKTVELAHSRLFNYNVELLKDMQKKDRFLKVYHK